MCALIPGHHFHFLRNGMFPTSWHNLTKEISFKECWWSFHPAAIRQITFICQCAAEGNFPSQIAPLVQVFWLFWWQRWWDHAFGPSHCERWKWACVFMCMHASTHSQPPASVPYRFSHMRVAEKTGKSPDNSLNSHTAQKLTIFVGQDRVKVRFKVLSSQLNNPTVWEFK